MLIFIGNNRPPPPLFVTKPNIHTNRHMVLGYSDTMNFLYFSSYPTAFTLDLNFFFSTHSLESNEI